MDIKSIGGIMKRLILLTVLALVLACGKGNSEEETQEPTCTIYASCEACPADYTACEPLQEGGVYCLKAVDECY